MWAIKAGLICKLPQQNMTVIMTPAQSWTRAHVHDWHNSLQVVWKSRKLEAEKNFPYSKGLQIDASLSKFFSTFPLLSTDLPIEAPEQFGRTAGDKLLNHL